MTRSEPFKVGNTAQNGDVLVVFVHTDNGTVIAEVYAVNVPGVMRLIRESEQAWVLLEDSIDRTALTKGPFVTELEFDLAELYHKYTVDLFVT